MIKTFIDSFTNLKKTRSLVIMGLLIAFMVVLDLPIFSLHLAENLKINFLFLPLTICAMFYGPVPCAMVCIVGDILGVVLSGKGVLPQLILVELIRGLVIGFIMYKKKPTIGRVIYSQSVANLFINMCLNTAALIWAGFLSSANVFASISLRIIKNLTLLPIEILILFFVLNGIVIAMKKSNIKL